MAKDINVSKLSTKKQVKTYTKLAELLVKNGYSVETKKDSKKVYDLVCSKGAELEVKDKVYSNFYGSRIMASMHDLKTTNKSKRTKLEA